MRPRLTLLSLFLLTFSGWSARFSRAQPVPIRVQEGRMLIQVQVNGKGSYMFQLNTECAEAGRMDTRLAKQLGLKIVGYEEVTQDAYAARREFLVGVDKLSVGPNARPDLHLIVGDYNRSAAYQPIDGLIGRGFFRSQLVTLDGPASQLVVSDGALNVRDPLVFPYAQPFVIPGKIGARPSRFNLNTGVAQALLFPTSQLSGIRYTNTPNRQQMTIGTVSFWVQEAVLNEDITIGSITLKTPRIFYSDKINQINLGVDFLKFHRLTIDQKNRLLRLD